MKVYARNPQTQKLFQLKFKPETRLEEPKQVDQLEPRELSLVLSREVAPTVRQFAEIYVTEKEQPIFLGYVERYEIDNKKEKTLTCKGMENLLNQRYAQPYHWGKETPLTTVLGEACVDLEQPGLLSMANSSVPPGILWEYEDETLNIVKIPDGGTDYRLSSNPLFVIGYRYLEAIGKAETLGTLDLIDGTYYQDASDLYVRLDDHLHRGWPDLGGLMSVNSFDTKVRLGVCPEKGLSGPLQTDFDKIGDLIVDVVLSHGLFVHFRDTPTNVYIDVSEEEGTWSEL